MSDVHSRTVEDSLTDFGVDPETGLSEAAIRRRRRRHGPNQLRRFKRQSAWRLLADQFKSMIVWLLCAAAVLSLYSREWAEGGAIVAVLAINTAIGFVSEWQAVRSMEALRRMARVSAKVRRAGRVREIPAQDIVPGDIVLLDAGDIVPADLRLIEAANIQCDESALTGESTPVAKALDRQAADAPVAERRNMVFTGTAVVSGAGVGLVAATAMNTELGKISQLVQEAEAEASPLEKRLDRLGGQLVWATLAIMPLIAAAGILSGKDAVTMAKTAIALAVAAVPEGLPIVATLALARGMLRLARRNAVVKRLSAVETLGATTIVMTDKTGTLTENRMSLVRLDLADQAVAVADSVGPTGFATDDGTALDPAETPSLRAALHVAVLCNDASLSDGDDAETAQGAAGVGDPMELALLAAGRRAGMERDRLLGILPEVRQESFDAATRMMATFHRDGDSTLVAVKGAPEAVIACCTHVLSGGEAIPLDAAGQDAWRDRAEALAGKGLRVLALARREGAPGDGAPYENLTLVGLAGLLDPPRPDVAQAIAAARQAGVRVIMLTGDHLRTARKIAADVGLAEPGDVAAIDASDLKPLDQLNEAERRELRAADVIARISPRAKLELVSLHQAAGAIVAMTGDGVNDAPALKKADIGIAMGQRGTQVAREAAVMVLRDDAFPSIVAAMRQGRVIFGNIRRFVVYLLSCNLSEILIIGLAAVSGLPLPLLPLQILYLNLVTDVFPAFALGVGEGGARVMEGPPRDPRSGILERRHWLAIGFYSALISLATLGAFTAALFWLGLPRGDVVTIAFVTLALAQLWHVFNMREAGSGVLRNGVTRNPYIWGALVLCLGLVVAAVFVPALAGVLSLAPLDGRGWLIAIGASLMPLLFGQVALLSKRRLFEA